MGRGDEEDGLQRLSERLPDSFSPHPELYQSGTAPSQCLPLGHLPHDTAVDDDELW